MNFKDFFKHFTLLGLALLVCVCFTGCGGNDDEPDDPYENETEGLGLISPDVLPGTWQIVSIKDDETGEVTNINRTFTIKDFDVLMQNDNVSTTLGMDIWIHSYDDLAYSTDSNDYSTMSMMFYKKSGSKLSSAKVYEFSTSLLDDNYFSNVVVAVSLYYSNNTLIAEAGSYSYTYCDENNNVRLVRLQGKLTMKKIK